MTNQIFSIISYLVIHLILTSQISILNLVYIIIPHRWRPGIILMIIIHIIILGLIELIFDIFVPYNIVLLSIY